jgi:hypothetical protein
MTFMHVFPGHVRTNIMSSAETFWIRLFAPISFMFSRLNPLYKTKEECGEWMMHGLISKEKGAMRMNEYGEDMDAGQDSSWAGTEEERKLLWEHTLKTINEALRENTKA